MCTKRITLRTSKIGPTELNMRMHNQQLPPPSNQPDVKKNGPMILNELLVTLTGP